MLRSKRRTNSRGGRSRRWVFVAGLLLGGATIWWLPRIGCRSADGPPADADVLVGLDDSWTVLPKPDSPIPPYAAFLKGVTIVLDPGHVGQIDPGGGWKRGPTGLREAEVNLRVAQYLRGFLRAAGARVIMTREVDRCLNLSNGADLRQRVEVANEAEADLLLSIHHNAVGTPRPNYTSLFYHESTDGGLAGLCAARHLLTGLGDALRLESHLPCAVLSDRLLYDNGLALLRDARVPAVLSEASFHSNPDEESRLRDPVYNRREAYGLFLGLARWAQSGLPRVRLAHPYRRGDREVLVTLDDGISGRGGWGAELGKILADSIVVRLDGEYVACQFDARRSELRVPLPAKVATDAGLYVDFQNTFGQHVLHPRIELRAGRR